MAEDRLTDDPKLLKIHETSYELIAPMNKEAKR
jgi:hypothetical protein